MSASATTQYFGEIYELGMFFFIFARLNDFSKLECAEGRAVEL